MLNAVLKGTFFFFFFLKKGVNVTNIETNSWAIFKMKIEIKQEMRERTNWKQISSEG